VARVSSTVSVAGPSFHSTHLCSWMTRKLCPIRSIKKKKAKVITKMMMKMIIRKMNRKKVREIKINYSRLMKKTMKISEIETFLSILYNFYK
jgi:hypothetical protein